MIQALYSTIAYNYTVSLMSVWDRSSRASRQEFTTMFWVMVVVGLAFAGFRQHMGWVSTKPILGQDGVVVGEFGIFPTWGLIPLAAFCLEGLLIHIPFYITCYRRLNDINFSAVKKIFFVLVLAIPIFGTIVFFWVMYKKPYSDSNKWGAPALNYKQKLAEFESRHDPVSA